MGPRQGFIGRYLYHKYFLSDVSPTNIDNIGTNIANINIFNIIKMICQTQLIQNAQTIDALTIGQSEI